MTTMLRKLTLRTCGASKPEILAALPKGSTKSVPLIRIAGDSTEAKVGQTDKGEFVKLLGEFHAVSLLNDQRYRSAVALLPSFISEPIAAALRGSPSVTFALEVSARRDDSSAVGYVFECRSLHEPEPEERMKRLLGAIGVDWRAAAPAAIANAKDEGEVAEEAEQAAEEAPAPRSFRQRR